MKLRAPWVLVAGLAMAGVASADDNDGISQLSVEVGETVSTAVGISKGLVCDDLTVISAEMHAGDAKNNLLKVTGLKPGETLCRIGNEMEGSRTFVHVTVTPADGKTKKSE
jgi:hypothetical protein